MTTVTISPKYQIVIPKNVRESLKLEPGQKVQVIAYNGRIELLPVMSINELRGRYSNIDTTIERDADRL